MIRNVIVVVLLAAAGLAAQSPASGNAETGKRQFVKLGCYTCHGYEGQGGGAGAKLAPHPIAPTALIAYVRHPAGSMPPFTKKVVSDEVLTDIHAYLASVPAPPPVKDIPLLNQ
ncbi:MAG: cytochrome c [Bryobacteraceae bacterium]|jgi:ubiquinol-cytochrome c reductase cytochrome c subunit